VGTAVTFTATASGCTSGAQYRFWTLAPTGGAQWEAVTPGYVSGNTFVWDTAGKAAGTWSITVWARGTGSTAAYEAAPAGGPLAYTLHGASACTGVVVAADPPSPRPAGTTVTLSAAAQTCPTAEYHFWLLPPGGSQWQAATPGYTGSNLFTWDTGGGPAGTWHVTVWARVVGSTAAYEAAPSSGPLPYVVQ
jgi:hypothetical protein